VNGSFGHLSPRTKQGKTKNGSVAINSFRVMNETPVKRYFFLRRRRRRRSRFRRRQFRRKCLQFFYPFDRRWMGGATEK